jgi:hypothetical protein
MAKPTSNDAVSVAAYSVAEFCASYRISRDTFYRILKTGCGPSIKKVGRRTLITVAAAKAWEESHA